MAEQITNYQCPACTGPLHFDAASGKLVCDYCGSAYEPAEIEALYAEKEAAAATASAQPAEPAPEGSAWSDAEAAGLKVYNCPSCGAELIFDETTTASGCPYCGNPTVVPGSLSGALRPDWIIPFSVTREAAVAELKKHTAKRPLLPKLFRSQNHLEEVKGVYAPFWLYDAQVSGSAQFHAETVRHWTEGSYDVTETKHYECFRSGSIAFSRIPVDSSTKMPDAHMDAIEPYDYGALKPFSTAYLPGFMAEKYDVSSADAEARARVRAGNSAVDAMAATVEGYTSVKKESSDLDFDRKDVRYALLPVWVLSTRWNGKNFLFTVNGQTGKMVGDLPISKGRFTGWMLGIAAGFTLVVSLLRVILSGM